MSFFLLTSTFIYACKYDVCVFTLGFLWFMLWQSFPAAWKCRYYLHQDNPPLCAVLVIFSILLWNHLFKIDGHFFHPVEICYWWILRSSTLYFVNTSVACHHQQLRLTISDHNVHPHYLDLVMALILSLIFYFNTYH